MKEKIYTIPVNDAFLQSEGDCPLCVLKGQLTSSALDFFLGPSLMQPNIRQSTNESGFCHEHANALYQKEENRLGLGLMMHTRMKHVADTVGQALDLTEARPRRGLVGRRKESKQRVRMAADQIRSLEQTCSVCDRISNTMAHYLDVICWMHRNDDAFRVLFQTTHHFCIPHSADLLDAAATHLDTAGSALFLADLREVLTRSLGEISKDVEWFTLKFDYRNHDKPWGNSKDAIIRAIRLLTGGNQKTD